ncbi:MAG TPA: nucleotide exchange factor GrpE [bacterium]|jgi:molecular chaperone GrpE|nr:nucleotide exchange factor GrpE [bacterium]HNT65783.1 nucleotide exchange factor GrpE [bacterium]HOX85472.1 nucleotide exchange factor GrpE [bacterium]HPG44631.1 nucleotide exchange factor GrpE [bacterium]HPM97189.1 nucleotide exchange factor GrpE [bacterium]
MMEKKEKDWEDELRKSTAEQEATDTNKVDELLELQKELEKSQTELEKSQKEREVLGDRLLRLMAEFDNFRKRSERERLQLIEQANAGLITALLPIVDDLQRSLASAEQGYDAEAVIAGMRMVGENFMRLLAERGLEPIASVGQEFDPEQHEAIMQVDAPGVESNCVVEEQQKGYQLNGKVIRHARVVVSR